MYVTIDVGEVACCTQSSVDKRHIMYEVLSMLGPLAPFIVQYLSLYARSAPTPGSTGTSCSSGCFSITKSSRVLLHVCQCHYGPTVFPRPRSECPKRRWTDVPPNTWSDLLRQTHFKYVQCQNTVTVFFL